MTGAPSAFCVACSASIERYEGAIDPVAFGQYGGALTRAIQRFKYEDHPHLARPLGALLRDACRRSRVAAEVVVPVPLHARRLVQRGYNQSALLAHHVAVELGVPVSTNALARVVDTAPQVELTRDARRANVDGAFRVVRAAPVEGRIVVLVDDVSTTGATLRACRHALLRAGVSRVTSVVVARTAPSMLEISSQNDHPDPM
jgi:ComF family protein